MNISNAVKLLEELGLTEYEARTINALFKFSEAEAPDISRNAEIPKTRVYDVLERLKEKGIVIEVYGRPKRYKVVDAQEVFKTLIKVRQEELNQLNGKVDSILAKENWKTNVSASEKLLQVKNIKDYNKLLSQEFDGAKSEICGFTHLDQREDAFRNLRSRKDLSVKLISKPMSRVLDLPNHINVQEKEHSMDAFVIDGKRVVMSLNDLTVPKDTYHLSVTNNNPTLAKAIMSHFNDYWKEK
ncbi:MAG: helix-turn-helix domain-containing protein [archaeon]